MPLTILSRSSTDSSLDFMLEYLLWRALLTVGPRIRKVCFFLNHVQSIELATGGLQSSCRDINLVDRFGVLQEQID